MTQNQQQAQGPSVNSELVIAQYQEELSMKTDELMKTKAYNRQLEYALVQLQKQLDETTKEEPKPQQQPHQSNNRKNRKKR